MSADLNENEFDLSQKAIGIELGGQGGQGQEQGQNQGGQGQGGQGQGGQGQGGQGQGGQGQGGQGQGGQGQGGQGQGQGGEGGNQGDGQEGDDVEDEGDEWNEGEGQDEGEDEDENEGEDEGEEDEGEGEDEDEQNQQNDSRIGQECVILFPKEFAGLMGTIQEVRYKGVLPNEIEPRNINGYILQLPKVEYTLFSIFVTNVNGENEVLPLMDIDIAFSGQNISYVESGRSFQGQVVQFVRTEPYLFLIDVGGANRLAEHCFITPEQANQQNQNDNNADDDDDDDDDDTQPENQENVFVPSLFWNYFLSKGFANDSIQLHDYSDEFYDVISDFNFLDKFLDLLGHSQIFFNKQTKQYGFRNLGFDVEKIQSNDYFAFQNILLFESVVYNGISEKTNFVYATTNYILKNLGQRMFFCDNKNVAEDFRLMVYKNDNGQIVFATRYQNVVIDQFEELYPRQLTMLARLRRFLDFEEEKPYLFLNFKQNTLGKIKPNIYYAKKFEDYCKALLI